MLLTIITIILTHSIVLSDKAHFNNTIIEECKYDLTNSIYIKSIPDSLNGAKGTTKLIQAHMDKDSTLLSFNWYSRPVFLAKECILINKDSTYNAYSIVRTGPWSQGSEPNKDDLAIEFFLNENSIKRYSTLDIYQITNDYNSSKSHYRVLGQIPGHKKVKCIFNGYKHIFEARTIDDNPLYFNPENGELLKSKYCW